MEEEKALLKLLANKQGEKAMLDREKPTCNLLYLLFKVLFIIIVDMECW